ncbi:hypothetical protein M153_2650004694 [Pseudoloma neurophilia]|uniref:Uncharacterized protein n=1 Tax=Pseudoloma neurophilia TaxID=146866 RepID=A0A0R0M5M5_9MICR|nr:hypothetical protein M153_2650004694 [Pseudoloma neurophilia]
MIFYQFSRKLTLILSKNISSYEKVSTNHNHFFFKKITILF